MRGRRGPGPRGSDLRLVGPGLRGFLRHRYFLRWGRSLAAPFIILTPSYHQATCGPSPGRGSEARSSGGGPRLPRIGREVAGRCPTAALLWRLGDAEPDVVRVPVELARQQQDLLQELCGAELRIGLLHQG